MKRVLTGVVICSLLTIACQDKGLPKAETKGIPQVDPLPELDTSDLLFTMTKGQYYLERESRDEEKSISCLDQSVLILDKSDLAGNLALLNDGLHPASICEKFVAANNRYYNVTVEKHETCGWLTVTGQDDDGNKIEIKKYSIAKENCAHDVKVATNGKSADLYIRETRLFDGQEVVDQYYGYRLQYFKKAELKPVEKNLLKE